MNPSYTVFLTAPTQLEIASCLEFVDNETWKDLDSKLLEEDKILSGLINSLKGGK